MLFDKVLDPRGFQNLSTQQQVILLLYICALLFEKPYVSELTNHTNHKETIVYGGLWKPVYDEEFKVFLGVVILIGVVLYKSNNESVEQLWSTLDGRPIFNRTMSRGRYQEILRFLRFDNAQSRQNHWSPDKLQPIRKVFETWALTPNGTPNGIYSGQKMKCEEHSFRLSTRCNDCIVLT